MTALATDLERTRRVQECLFRIFEILARPASLEEHLAAIHAELYDVLDASNLYVAMYDPTSELYVFPYNADEDDDDYTPQHLRKSLTDYVRRSAEPLLCNEAVHHVLCKAGEVDLVGEPSPVWMGAPMVTERGAIGVVVVQSFTDPDAYEAADLDTLALVARCMAHAVEGAWSRRRIEAQHAMRLQELVDSRDEALAASAAKSTFLAMMSHELRTPLTAILGYADLLDEELVDVGFDAVGDVERIRSAASHLLRVISDILDLSRIEAGQEEVELGEVDLAELVDSALVLTRPQLDAAGNRVALRLGQLGPLHTDGAKLRQVLVNLVANATAHTREGTITVRASYRTYDDGRWLEIDVSDTGEGIAPDVLPRLYRLFEQADASTRRRRDGTGLGLAIVAGYCKLLGGGVSAHSVPGEGSTFTVRLPA